MSNRLQLPDIALLIRRTGLTFKEFCVKVNVRQSYLSNYLRGEFSIDDEKYKIILNTAIEEIENLPKIPIKI